VEIEYSVYALRQASRCSWRIGQARPVEVYFAVYAGPLQAEALSLVGRKLRAALLVEGELPQEGLATQERDDGDLMLTLAKRLAAGERAESQALETLFAESRALEARAGESLDATAWEGRDDLDRGGDTPDPQGSAAVTIDTPTRQTALPTVLVAPPPRSDPTAARGDANTARIPTSTHHPNAPLPLEAGEMFIPSAGKVVPLVGRLGLAAPPTPPRRRKPPARDQLKLFG